MHTEAYGALEVAKKYCEINRPVHAPGIWQHGCFAPWLENDPDTITYHSKGIEYLRIFVARKQEKATLHRNGYKNTYSIGLPFIYTDDYSVKKQTNSLLVMPVHSIFGEKDFVNLENIEAYAHSISKLKNKFKNIVLCLHSNDIKHNLWIKEFQKYSIKYILGADPSDLNSLDRLKKILLSFEYVTTNDWGSHLAYALTVGCKCSIWGPKLEHSDYLLLKAPGIGSLEKGRKRIASKRKNMRVYFSHLFNSPENGVCDVKLGDYLVGRSNKVSPNDMKRLFEWNRIKYDEIFNIHINKIKYKINKIMK